MSNATERREAYRDFPSDRLAQKCGFVVLRQDGSEKNVARKKAREEQRELPGLPVKAIRVEDLTSENYTSGDARDAYDLAYGQGCMLRATTH